MGHHYHSQSTKYEVKISPSSLRLPRCASLRYGSLSPPPPLWRDNSTVSPPPPSRGVGNGATRCDCEGVVLGALLYLVGGGGGSRVFVRDARVDTPARETVAPRRRQRASGGSSFRLPLSLSKALSLMTPPLNLASLEEVLYNTESHTFLQVTRFLPQNCSTDLNSKWT